MRLTGDVERSFFSFFLFSFHFLNALLKMISFQILHLSHCTRCIHRYVYGEGGRSFILIGGVLGLDVGYEGGWFKVGFVQVSSDGTI